MTKSKQETTQDEVLAVDSALGRTEQFIERNQKMLTYVVIGILVVVGSIIAYYKLYRNPLEKEALSQMFRAEQYFEADSFKLALNGDGNYAGFLSIIEDYSSTKAGNLAHYYAGICYMNLGDYDKAIESMNSFSSSDKMLAPISKGVIGDAYQEKGDAAKAIEYYEKAAGEKNSFTAPVYLMKLGQLYELKNDNKNALATYQKIKDEYFDSNEGRMVEKYIARVKIKLGEL